MQAAQTKDLERVRSVLAQDPIAAAYMLGDLDPTYAHHCTWWVASEGGKDVAVLQVYNGLSAPVVLTYGAPAGIAAIATSQLEDLPWRAHVHLSPDHLAALQPTFAFERLRPMMRMGVHADGLRADVRPPGPEYQAVARLGHRDTGDIVALSQFYPDSFFEPHQLSSGHYYGIRTAQGQLVSVAGVHIVSHTDRLAAIGNVVTHPEHRGRGLSTACTAHLAGALAHAGMNLLVLNVQRENEEARRVYEKLGFREHCTYLEGFLVRALEGQPRS
ncbi:MAG: GNAT family N-acetyltransferase [Myxococcota bacterium]